MQFLQAEELKEKEKVNHKLLNDLEEKQTRCSKLVTNLVFFSIAVINQGLFLGH